MGALHTTLIQTSHAIESQPHHKPASRLFSKGVIPGLSWLFVFTPFSLLAIAFLGAQGSFASLCSNKAKRKNLNCTTWTARQGVYLPFVSNHLPSCMGSGSATGGLSAPKTTRKNSETARKRRRADCSEMAQLSQQRVLLTLRALGS